MRRLEISDGDFGMIRSRLCHEKAAYLDAARQADKKFPGDGDGWRAQAAETHRLIRLMDTAETF